MNKGIFRRSGLAALSALTMSAAFALPFAAPGAAQTQENVNCSRLAGADRFETAAAIALDTFATADTVLIARGDGTPTNPSGVPVDALAGSYGAGVVNGPILLTLGSGPIDDATLDAIDQLGATKATILGQTAAVSQAVENELNALLGDANVDRVGGDDRFATAAQIAGAGAIFSNAAGETSVFLANGVSAVDALSAGGPAFAENIPILLTNANALHEDAAAFIDENNIDRVYILGGEVAISSTTASQVTALNGGTQVTRLAGENRAATAVDIAIDFLIDELGWSTAHFNLANGAENHLVDAVAGGPHAGVEESMILLASGTDTLGDDTEAFLTDLSDGDLNGEPVQEPQSAHILGGPAAINDETARDACTFAGIEPGPGGAATALSLTPETDTNPVGSAHTVTATLTNADGGRAVGDVRFEVYRRGANPGCGGFGGAGSSDCYTFVTGQVVAADTNTGTAQFTYTGPNTADDDRIVACVVTAADTPNESCTRDNANTPNFNEEGSLEVDRATLTARNLDNDRPVDDAGKSWQARRAAALNLTPDSDINPTGSNHTVTATVTDQFGSPVAGQTVTFELFRDTDNNGTFVNVADTADNRTNANGQVALTYTGNEAGVDRIVACVEGADADNDCTTSPAEANSTDVNRSVTNTGTPGAVTFDPDETAIDDARKEWVARRVQTLVLTPETDINPSGTQHQVTATVTDNTGNPVSGQQVRFEVFADTQGDGTGFVQVENRTATTNAQGVATITYSGPNGTATNRLDRIVACSDPTPGTAVANCADLDVNNNVVVVANQPSDSAEKEWARVQQLGTGTTAQNRQGTIIALDEVNDVVTIQSGNEFFTFDYTGCRLEYPAGTQTNETFFESRQDIGDVERFIFDPAAATTCTVQLTNQVGPA